jgi:putative hemolysin
MRSRPWLPRASEKTIDRCPDFRGKAGHGGREGVTNQSQITGVDPQIRADEKPYDMRRLSYAGTFTNPFKAGTIRAIEWLTAKVQLLRLIRQFEMSGAPHGPAFWPKAIRHMGIRIDTPPDEIAHIPATGPVVVVANHPHGLVDGMVMAEMVNRVRSDFKILTRSLLTGIPNVEMFMIPVPFPHEENSRELGLQMRADTMDHLKRGGVIILFPAGKVAASETWFGPAVEAEWNVFTHKMIQKSGATIVPIRFTGQNSRAYQIANKVSATLRQGLLLYEIKRALFRPQRPHIGAAIPASVLKDWEGNPRGFLAWLREHTLGLGQSAR